MNNAERVIVNTAAQYLRTIINICLSLYSTRLILSALGIDDYGIYTLIAGMVSLLSFAVNAMVVTTQRYMSFYNGKQDLDKLKEIFSNSVFIHLLLGITIAIIIEIIGVFLFDGFLNIESDRINAAKIVYHCVTLMLILSFLAAPFRALLISHENIIYITIVDVIDGILKLIIAIAVSYASVDRLIFYAELLSLINLFNLLAFSVYDKRKYYECVLPRLKDIKLNYLRDISSFASWTIYSVGCVAGRTQGVSIILNKFFSVAVNAAFGVALHVSGALSFLSHSVMNAMNPQIVKAEGSNNRKRMLRLAEIESKFCFLLIGMVVIPCIFEMPVLLSFWLKEVPEHAVLFCRFILLTSLVDQLTIGLGTANQAVGDIKNYSLTVNSIKLMTLAPILMYLYYYYNGLVVVMLIYVSFEFICAMSRLFFLKQTAGLSISGFAKRVFLLEIIPTLSAVLVSYLISSFNFQFRFVATVFFSIITVAITTYYFGLYDDEKDIVRRVIARFY